MTESPLRRISGRLADLLILALLVALTALPLVTGFAGLAAAAAVLADPDDQRPTVHRYTEALRRTWRPHVGVQLLVLAVAAVGAADLLFATQAAVGPGLRSPVGGLGLLLLLAVLTVPAYAAVLTAQPTPKEYRGRSARLLLDAGALTAATPVTATASLLVAGGLLAWCYVVPALTLPLLGTAAVVSLLLADRALRRVSRRHHGRPRTLSQETS